VQGVPDDRDEPGDSVKAVVCDGPRQVSVKAVPDARIERPTDLLVRITSAYICGSDLHVYEVLLLSWADRHVS
jgi:D-arabinose 1-dehydrogenase-like Zn-dependent alcohol dehydrogenase